MMRSFVRDVRGFVLVFSLLVMPVFIGFAFIIIDIGRGNNAHADLAAAADAVALAGARELDGGTDAIEQAKAAMANLTNTVSMLGPSGPDAQITLIYEDTPENEFVVTFLTDIPVLDTTPIDSAWLTDYATNSGAAAEFIHVRAQSRNLDSVFFNPASLLPVSVPVSATAVATSNTAACKIPPLYICNPFEFEDGIYKPDLLQTSFENGHLHGRLIRLHPPGSSTQSPGNFGFLSVNDPEVNSGARAISDLFAGRENGTCYSSDTVETKPGASAGIRAGLNTRFDMYMAPYQTGGTNGPDGFTAKTSPNVRKGIYPNSNASGVDDCVTNGGGIDSQAKIGDDHVWDPTLGFNADGIDDYAYGLPDNLIMTPPNAGVAGAYIGSGPWAIQEYLDRNYGAATYDPDDIPNSFRGSLPYSGPGDTGPSRYDVYSWELSAPPNDIYKQRAAGDPSVTSPAINGETGEAMCKPAGSAQVWDPNDPAQENLDPRVLPVAIIDCGTYGDENGRTNFPVNSYASVFMTRPMMSYGPSSDATIDIEIIDISGYGGNGSLETFIRDEAILVR